MNTQDKYWDRTVFFKKDDIKRNLWGCLDTLLMLPYARERFSKSREAALKSFIIPIILFPVTLMILYMFPDRYLSETALTDNSQNTVALLYTVRFTVSWGIFLGFVYLLAKQIKRTEYFYQFVVATNWLSLPATLLFIPIGWALLSGAQGSDDITVYVSLLAGYTYLFTAYMAVNVLRIPWELAGFITMVSIMINDTSLDVIGFIGKII